MELTSKIAPSRRTATSSQSSVNSHSWLIASVPFVFVLCWASGFVVPRAFEYYSEPLTFVTLRTPAPSLCWSRSPSAIHGRAGRTTFSGFCGAARCCKAFRSA